MAGKNRVTRAPGAGRGKTDPGPSRSSEASQRGSTPGPVVPGPTSGSARSPRRGSSVPVQRAGVRDMTAQGTVFDRADAGNRRLGSR